MLKGKNIILTGSNRGIGISILQALVKNGANVWACCRKPDVDFLSYTEQLSSEYHVWVKVVCFDLNDIESIDLALQSIVDEKEKIDVLINNAGITDTALLQHTTIDKIKEIFEVNYFSQLRVIKKISKAMIRQKKGCIVNMASVAGMEHQPGRIAYGSSKAALIWATQSLAKEFGPFNIRINAVAPGAARTEMTSEYSEEKIKKIVSETSLRRLAEVDEIVKTVIFLCSDNSSFITGQVIKVDGGR
ncbi:SDR family oxidoreductase [Bacteroides sp. OttesenSCG-928-D19]|nr:SDR family oxidoreductase [Bacteroides sp. OttesenSCG-928-D19]